MPCGDGGLLSVNFYWNQDSVLLEINVHRRLAIGTMVNSIVAILLPRWSMVRLLHHAALHHKSRQQQDLMLEAA